MKNINNTQELKKSIEDEVINEHYAQLLNITEP
jgi:hypothetical protein